MKESTGVIFTDIFGSLSTQEAALEAQAVRQTSSELQLRFIYPLGKRTVGL
jgi:hypothetical protein